MNMIIIKYFWILFIVTTIVNVYILKSRVQPHIDKNPDLKNGYDNIFRNFLIYGIIPWIIMGAGVLSGKTNGIFDFLNPRALNPFVLTFHLYIIIINLLLFRWIYFKKGAEFLSQHPGIIVFRGFGKSKEVTSPNLIKLFFALAFAGGITGMTMMWLSF
jgi:hypothetical protein